MAISGEIAEIKMSFYPNRTTVPLPRLLFWSYANQKEGTMQLLFVLLHPLSSKDALAVIEYRQNFKDFTIAAFYLHAHGWLGKTFGWGREWRDIWC